ncbi:hypothetical protein RvY_10043 [Ramazzottius varieornatus]|uniref:Major facilitator superfamily (MFS) profile domain-containing protein n=1 Tax=Ramazzottius varieornatus TaxID=947166 RepID=A0A1D1VGS9_RAMVA|nr:hypothetical protein RvY_10043 [Ramazzottius varieornatus]
MASLLQAPWFSKGRSRFRPLIPSAHNARQIQLVMERQYLVDTEDASESTEFLPTDGRRPPRSKERRRTNQAPVGVLILQRLCIPTTANRALWYRVYILVLTFIFYVTYHLSRRPLSIVKTVLHQNCSPLTPPAKSNPAENETWCSWKPFEQSNNQELFAVLDFAYWLAYAFGMFFAGHIAERTNLRHFLTFGMMGAGLFTICFGMAQIWEIHSFSYFVAVQIFGGIFQSTGWPSVVTLVGNWFGKKRLGLIFGVWNSHTSVGNILGAVIAGVWVNQNWGYSFIIPGLIILVTGLLANLFVVEKPEDVLLPQPDHVGDNRLPGAPSADCLRTEEYGQVDVQKSDSDIAVISVGDNKPISIPRALRIPGVVEFSVCLFFAKAVSYTFLLWLPKYIKSVSQVENDIAADLSAIFDAGGIVGGIVAGVVSDATGASATVCGVMFLLAAPSLWLIMVYGGYSIPVLIALLLFGGLIISGPYALITTAVSADLGTHPSLTGNAKALATVTAIIDGTGSMGAAFGPLAAGLISTRGWDAVFYSLTAAQLVALMCLTRLIYREIRGWLAVRREVRNL